MKKKILLIAFPLALGIAGFFYFRNVQAKASAFKVGQVSSGVMEVSLSASGEIKAEEDVSLQFPTSGLVSWVGVKKGDWVKKGQAIASLDTRELRKKLDKTLNLYMTQRNSFEQTQEDYQDEKERLLLTDEIKRILNTTQNSLSNTVLDVELNDLAIKLSTIYSPFAGMVISEVPYAGANILATTATVRIVNPETLYFEALVDETEISKAKVGDRVKIKLDAFPDEIFEGKVGKIDFNASLSSGGGTAYKTHIFFDEPKDSFRLGMNGDAEIILDSIGDALLVPLSALSEKEGKTYVWRVENDKARKIEIAVENTNDDFAQVTSGLLAGDKIIASGISLVKEGMAIKP